MSPPAAASPRLDRRKLRELVERTVAETGADLEDLVEQKAGSRRLLRVAVDREGGVTSDDLSEVSHALSVALDASDVMGEAPYVLEVTSPGVDRPLTLPRHWRRNVGRLVKVTLVQGGELTGRVTAADEDGTDLLIDGAAEPRRLAYADVAKAKVQVEFNRAGAEDELAGLEDSEDAESTGVDGDAADQDGVDWDGAEPGAESGGGAGTDES
ncbi:MAG TPA: ribosome maturation factor RimP [Actinocrinis sp.]|jgi:ribosome maturation factor RimP|uniref:ribosome maturation factor RimP n=1 Tax=Actinocrinis sp. TaxID=1920516 RepID=UPI002DDC94A4|nr:ribosome maturation factor RimP [Actinocrinis sp.]HEV3170005.1 ribosome maturation factor RimP [Actinocrinis sp.]